MTQNAALCTCLMQAYSCVANMSGLKASCRRAVCLRDAGISQGFAWDCDSPTTPTCLGRAALLPQRRIIEGLLASCACAAAAVATPHWFSRSVVNTLRDCYDVLGNASSAAK
eukprot:7319237-Alexandrium_andersonii.AAC.1